RGALPAARGQGPARSRRVPGRRGRRERSVRHRRPGRATAGRGARGRERPRGRTGDAAALRGPEPLPRDLLARWLQLSGDLPQPMTAAAMHGERAWTNEQLEAIERRHGDLLLDAGAGSGKTSVLVERFVRSVLEDEVDVSAILTI